MNQTPLPSPRLHPALLIAALSVTALSLAGIGALTGTLPTAHGQVASPAPQQTAPVATTTPVPTPPAPSTTPHRGVTKTSAPKTVRTATPADIAVPTPPVESVASMPPPPIAMPPALCHDCGVIETVREVTSEGETQGLGAVAGGLLGGLLGHQIGNGRGNNVATVLGAVGGAYAGHQAEKARRRTTRYEVVIRFDDGTRRVLPQDMLPTWRMGERVKFVNGVLTAAA